MSYIDHVLSDIIKQVYDDQKSMFSIYFYMQVLTNSCVGHAGVPNDGLSSLCPNVVDLDLSSNELTDWKDMLTILSNLQCLKFVNLARNKLQNKEVYHIKKSQL